MANSLSSVSRIVADTAQVNNFKYITNTKGNILITDSVLNLVEFPVGTDNQILTADSTTATGLKWSTVATPSVNISNLTGSILTYASATSYSLFNPHTVVLGSITNINVEIQYIPYASTIIALNIIPAGTANWPAGSNFTFDIGYLRGNVSTNPPNEFSTVSGSTCTYVPIAGTTLTVDNSYSGTRNPATVYLNVATLANENITVRCINSTSSSGTILTPTIWLRTTI